MAQITFKGMPHDANKDVKAVTIGGMEFKKGASVEVENEAVIAKCDALGYFDIELSELEPVEPEKTDAE